MRQSVVCEPAARLWARNTIALLVLAHHYGVGEAGFPTRNIWQTNPVSGQLNKINLVWSSDQTLVQGAQIAISGLTSLGWQSGFSSLPLSDLPGYIAHSYKFACGTTAAYAGGKVCWSYGSGEVTFTIVEGFYLYPGTVVGVSFQLVNARLEDQYSPPVSIRFVQSGEAAQVMQHPPEIPFPAIEVEDGSQILRIVVPAFTQRLAVQSSWVQGQQNRITCYLTTNVELITLDIVSITGLKPTNTPSSIIGLAGSGAPIFASQGSFTAEAGILAARVMAPTLASNTQVVIVFELTNVAYAVASPDIYVSKFTNPITFLSFYYCFVLTNSAPTRRSASAVLSPLRRH
jgi:hypothetical protein